MITIQKLAHCVIIRLDGEVQCIYRPGCKFTVKDVLESLKGCSNE